MTKLSDTQLVLLTAAAARPDGSLLPPPASLSDQGTRLSRSVAGLIKRALVSEAPVTTAALAWRSDEDSHYGAFITAAGRQAIGIEEIEQPNGVDAITAAAALPAETAESAPAKPSKTALVVGLMTRDGGATLAELVAATGWLPHTTRAALTGLRKKGHAITRGTRDAQSCYTIGAGA